MHNTGDFGIFRHLNLAGVIHNAATIMVPSSPFEELRVYR